MWLVLALLGAFTQATYLSLNKFFLKKIDKYVLGAGIFLTSAVLLMTASLIRGLPVVNDKFFVAVLITGIINVITTILILEALKNTDASLVIPILSFTPAFTILTSFLILKEVPSKYGIFGILLIIVGAYILNSESIKFKKILEPFKKIFLTRGLILALIVAFLYSISTVYDKVAVVNSDPIFGSAIICFFIAASLIIIVLIRGERILKEINLNLPKFGLSGLINALSIFLINTALTLQIVPYVSSIKRTSVLFGVLYGYILFKEKNVGKRFFGALIMVLGVVLIILYR